jgi:hypothetical protein
MRLLPPLLILDTASKRMVALLQPLGLAAMLLTCKTPAEQVTVLSTLAALICSSSSQALQTKVKTRTTPSILNNRLYCAERDLPAFAACKVCISVNPLLCEDEAIMKHF